MSEQAKTQPRIEQAKLEIGHTEMSLGVKGALFAVGLLTLLAVPAAQSFREMRQHAGSQREHAWPHCCEIVDDLPRAVAACCEHEGGWLSKIFRANAVLSQAIDEYEQELKSESFLTQFVLPPTQEMLVHVGGGNEQAYVGRRRWLFYRPGIDYCTGPGFLTPQQMAYRSKSGTPWQPPPQPDPRAAILQFHRQLAERNIRLVLVPTPDKATIHSEKFSSRYQGWRTSVHNPSYRQMLDELQAEGVLVCDVTEVLVQYRDRSGRAVYLATDTHWRPEAMELAATELARFIELKIAFDTARADAAWRRTTKEVRNLGDIAVMLRLRQNQGIFAEEVATIHPVTDAASLPWRPDPGAEVLLLGDSFANIYSLETMNWGGAAGLAEQLSCTLQRPVDTILRNDAGAYATREMLRHALAQGEDRLAGKKVVVWQFAVRELAVGDWKLLDMTLQHPRRPDDGTPPADRELLVSGTIAAKSAAPRAGRMPYADHIFTLDLTDLQVHRGTLSEPKIAVYLFSMRNQRNTPAFSWPIGKRVELKLQPWSPGFFRRYGRINRTETDDIELKRPWWGEVIE